MKICVTILIFSFLFSCENEVNVSLSVTENEIYKSVINEFSSNKKHICLGKYTHKITNEIIDIFGKDFKQAIRVLKGKLQEDSVLVDSFMSNQNKKAALPFLENISDNISQIDCFDAACSDSSQSIPRCTVIDFSMIGFSTDGKRAILCYEESRSDVGGYSAAYILVMKLNRDNQWKIAKEINIWLT